jgi:uncharacterized membrane protein YcaP (DUF421 family)
MHYPNSFLSYRSLKLDALTAGTPRVLVQNGQMIKEAMAAEHVNEAELLAMLRLNQVDEIKDVARGTLETNGQLSVIKTDEAKELEKRDLEEAQG